MVGKKKKRPLLFQDTSHKIPVPESLKTLLRKVVLDFYGEYELMVVANLQKKEVMTNEDFKRLGFGGRALDALMHKFKNDRMIDFVKTGSTTTYHINYKKFLNYFRYRVELMRLHHEREERAYINREIYKCTNQDCGRPYKAEELGDIYNPMTYEFYCWRCESKVNENDTLEPRPQRSILATFNIQMKPYFDLLTKVEKELDTSIWMPPDAPSSPKKPRREITVNFV